MKIKREHLTARVTRGVKEAVRRRAEAEGISISQLVFEAVRDRVLNGESKQNDEAND